MHVLRNRSDSQARGSVQLSKKTLGLSRVSRIALGKIQDRTRYGRPITRNGGKTEASCKVMDEWGRGSACMG
jgi:hypothetical protein